MAFTLEVQLKLIHLLCKVYFVMIFFLQVIIFLNVTLPKICNEDTNTFYCVKIFAYYILINVLGNYACMWYTSGRSIVKPEHLKSLPGPSVYSSQDLTWSATSSVSDGDLQLAVSDYHDLNKKPTSNGEYTGHLTSTGIYENKNISLQRSSLAGNCKHKIGSYFTFQNGLDGYSNISQEISSNHFDSKLSLSSNTKAAPAVVVTRRSKCKDCNTLVPARAKHCPVCKHCVLKRDHHCFFVGCCVGYHNQRFFILFCLYAGISEIFNSVVTFLYLRWHSFGESPSWGYLVYVLPILLCICFMGEASGSALGMVTLLYWSVLMALACVYFFCVQMNLVYHGQTKYEYLKGIKTYQGSVWTNVTSVFGRYWLIGLFMPAPFLGYQSSGADWRQLISDSKIV